MHLHGFEQIVVAKDGEPLDQPYAADTVLVAPGERYTVLFNPTAPGTWVWHCHILNHVESADGMFGMVTALIVQSSAHGPSSGRGDDVESMRVESMRAWAVDLPGPVDTRTRWWPWSVPRPNPVPARCGCGWRPAACAAPTCTSPRATSPRSGPARCRATRSSAGRRARRRARAGSTSASGSASPGCARPAGGAASAVRGRENLCLAPAFTGWDADGGYAELAVVAEALRLRDARLASTTSRPPRCCAPGIIGYRALRRAELPPGGRLGIYGFGASAHLAAQVALAEGATCT